jgi:hypothetical protein
MKSRDPLTQHFLPQNIKVKKNKIELNVMSVLESNVYRKCNLV